MDLTFIFDSFPNEENIILFYYPNSKNVYDVLIAYLPTGQV